MVKGSRLTFIKITYKCPKGDHKALYQCSCGNVKEFFVKNVTRGLTKSCGCWNKELMREKQTTHGMSHTGEYHSYNGMIARCYNTNLKRYKDWGGRGISVCERWLESFENFYEDMGPKPSNGYTIERIDNNGNYTPENCIWATQKEQGRNQRTNVHITYNNITLTVSEWSEKLGIKAATIYARVRKGKSPEECLKEVQK